MSSIARPARLRAEIDALADLVEALRFGLHSEARTDRVARRDHLANVLRRYLDPRLARPGGPLVVAIFGPTGSGKSTILNTLAGRPISRSGPLRPTTRAAVVWAHEEHLDAGPLATISGSGPVEVVGDDHPLLHDLVIVDTPDIDSVVREHRAQTEEILAAADVAVAVTTPQRYADAVPWDVLAALSERELEVVAVMNRSARRSSGAVSDLAALLRDARLGGVRSARDVLVVQEQRTKPDGRLPAAAIRRITSRLEALASRRSQAALEGIAGSGRHAVTVARELAAMVEDQAAEGAVLGAVVDEAVESQRTEVADRLAGGDLVREEVVARWQRLVGVSDLAAVVSRGVARIRDLVSPAGVVDPESVARVEGELRDELVELGMRRAERARTGVELAWAASAAGTGLLSAAGVDPPDVRTGLEDSVEAWQAEVVGLVASVGRGRFRLARAASVGINAAATLLLLGAFASTGGITGTEVGVAAGAAAAQQTVLERLFGSAAASRLAQQAQKGLTDRFGEAIDSAVMPFRAALAAAVDDLGSAGELRDAAARLEQELEAYLG